MKLRSLSATELVNLDQIVRIKEHFGNVKNHTELQMADGSKVWLPKGPLDYLRKWGWASDLEGIGG